MLDAFWTIPWVFASVFWTAVLVTVVFDVFRSRDLSGPAKALWFLFVLVLALVGVLVYLIARGHGMAERAARRGQEEEAEEEEEAAFRHCIEDVASKGNVADQLTKLSDLHDRGEPSDEEHDQAKHRLVA